MEPQPRDIEIYQDQNGELSFENWLNQLRDARARLKIKARLARVALGNIGDCNFIDEGVFELRIDYGAGYRIYFGQVGAKVILLLCGGDKSSQDRDIKTAKAYWRDYAKRKSTDK